MDPNTALADLRAFIERLRRQCEIGAVENIDALADLLADRFEALDGWLTKGGALPRDWATGGRV